MRAAYSCATAFAMTKTVEFIVPADLSSSSLFGAAKLSLLKSG